MVRSIEVVCDCCGRKETQEGHERIRRMKLMIVDVDDDRHQTRCEFDLCLECLNILVMGDAKVELQPAARAMVKQLVDKQRDHLQRDDEPVPGDAGCPYKRAYVSGICGKPSMQGSKYCAEHSRKRCVTCDSQATHECSYAGSIAVCGAPLCDDKECEEQHDYSHR